MSKNQRQSVGMVHRRFLSRGRDARGQGKVLQRGCARSSLSNYPDHRRSPTETSGDNTPRSPDFPWCRLTHYPSTSSISLWGCSTSWRPPSWRGATTKTGTRAYCPEEWHAAGRRIVRRHDVVLTEGTDLHTPMMTGHPVDRVQGTSYRGQTRVGICQRSRGVIVGSRVENIPRALALFLIHYLKRQVQCRQSKILGKVILRN